MIYQWRNQNYKTPADVVGKRIEELEKANGVCHPQLLVDDARPVASPLHPLFEWDNAKAAESYRVEQARGVLQAIRVVFEPGMNPAPAFVHVRTEAEGPGYVSIIRAMSDAQMRAQVLNDALAQVEALKARYQGLEELRPIWRAAQRVKRHTPAAPRKKQATRTP